MSGVSTVFSFALALIIGYATIASGAAISSAVDERNSNVLMRKEKQIEHHMQLDLDVTDNGTQAAGASQAHPTGMCDQDFPVVQDDALDCTGIDGHDISTPERCFQAADEANATHITATEVLGSEWQNNKPKGCFAESCDDPKGICYFFNPVMGAPQNLTAGAPGTGKPVCRRPKFLYGAQHDGSFPYTDGGCATGYATIMNEANCSEAAECLNLPRGTFFRMAEVNESRRDDFPEGCFIHDKGPGSENPPKVYFNPPINDTSIPKPRWPFGTPICNVSTITLCKPGSGCGPVDSRVHEHTRTISRVH